MIQLSPKTMKTKTIKGRCMIGGIAQCCRQFLAGREVIDSHAQLSHRRLEHITLMHAMLLHYLNQKSKCYFLWYLNCKWITICIQCSVLTNDPHVTNRSYVKYKPLVIFEDSVSMITYRVNVKRQTSHISIPIACHDKKRKKIFFQGNWALNGEQLSYDANNVVNTNTYPLMWTRDWKSKLGSNESTSNHLLIWLGW